MQKENEKAVINTGHSKLDLESSTPAVAVTKQTAWKIPYQVRDDVFINSGGFTLIELLVVVLIIGILSAVAVPQYQKAVLKSRYATLKNLTRSIANAQEAYYLANAEYSTDFSALDIDVPGGQTSNSTPNRAYYDWGSCHSLTSGDYQQLYCRRNYMGYMIRLAHSPTDPNTRICIVFTNGPHVATAIQICKQETGISTESSSDNSAKYYLYSD